MPGSRIIVHGSAQYSNLSEGLSLKDGRVANRPDFRPRDFGQGTLVS